MKYILLLITVLGVTLQNIFAKQYSTKTENSDVLIYSSMVSFFAMLFFLVASGGKLSFNKDIVLYSAAFGAFYCMSVFGNVNAVRTGPLSISTLINQFSLLIPTLYGITVLQESIGAVGYIGIVLLLSALYLINMRCDGEKKASKMWLLWVALAFIGNGMCSTVQKMQQLEFSGEYKNEFMIVALFISSVIMLAAGIIKKRSVKEISLKGIKYAAPQGLCNGLVNLLVMMLTAILPTAVLFPVISAGGIGLTFIIALLIYKEKLRKPQMVGYVLGILSVIMLNI